MTTPPLLLSCACWVGVLALAAMWIDDVQLGLQVAAIGGGVVVNLLVLSRLSVSLLERLAHGIPGGIPALLLFSVKPLATFAVVLLALEHFEPVAVLGGMVSLFLGVATAGVVLAVQPWVRANRRYQARASGPARHRLEST